jgi:carboxypeptidase C (cathepsin A)
MRLSRVIAGVIVVGIAGAAISSSQAAAVQVPSTTTVIPPLVIGDEPIVVAEHHVQTARGPLTYETRVGRLAIRNEETGEVRGRIFFSAYVVQSKGAKRPLLFAWNGGPTGPSNLVHLELMGPRRRVENHVVDNAETLLVDSDLVFYDPIETGFSRPEKPNHRPMLRGRTRHVSRPTRPRSNVA